MKLSNYIITGVFLLVIAFFSVWTWYKGDLKTSVIENRALAQRPDATVNSIISGTYTKRFETYFDDQFPSREKFIELNSQVKKNLLRQHVVRGVFVHPDGYLLSAVPNETDGKAKEIANRINLFAAQNAKIGVKTYFALVPNKPTMMENKFPSYFPSYGIKDTNQLLKHVDANAHPLNLLNAVKKHSNEKNLYAYTDHHWKAKAAFYAYQSTITEMAKNNPEIGKPYKYNDFSWNEKGKPFYGSDARTTTKAYVKKYDTITVATPKFDEKPLNVCYDGKCNRGLYSNYYLTMNELYTNRYLTYIGGDHPETIIYNPNKTSGKKLLIIKDSYANATIQFFARNFKETRVLDLRKYTGMPIETYIKKNKIDVVLIVDNVNSIYVTPSLTNYDHPGLGENQ
jgi:hypothetical protein